MSRYTGKRPYQCTHYNNTFLHNSNLQRHMKIHNKPNAGSQCDNTEIKEHLTADLVDSHNQCSQCKKSFSKSDCMTTHMLFHIGGILCEITQVTAPLRL